MKIVELSLYRVVPRLLDSRLLRIPKKCEGGAKGDAKEVAKEVARPPNLLNLT